MEYMSTASINNLSSYLQSALNTALQSSGVTTNQAVNSLNSLNPFSIGEAQDSSELSPFARMLNALQQLQQTDPAKYKQVTEQIATNLQSAAKTAQSDGNATAAKQLNQLATDFTKASQSGQLPDIQDLAQALSGGGHHHHHHHSGSASSGSSDSTGSSSSSSSSSTGSSTSTTSTQTTSTSTTPTQTSSTPGTESTDHILSAFRVSLPANDSFNPFTIITNTLAAAGVSVSNSQANALTA